MTEWLVICAGLSLGIFLVYAGLRPDRAKRTGLDLPTFALIFLLVGAAWLYWESDPQGIGLISALLVAASALFGLLFNASVKRQDDGRQRRERRDDIQRAIRTEIDVHVTMFQEYDWDDLKIRLRDAFAADGDYLPFAPIRQRDRLLSKLLGQIDILDENQIGPVMRYYTLAAQITSLTAELRSAEYKALAPERREKVFLSVLELEETLLTAGRNAIQALGGAIFGEPPARQAEVNKTDPAPSDRAGED